MTGPDVAGTLRLLNMIEPPAAPLDPLAPLREHQGGRCGMCQQERPLVVDHDHETMLVRGYLCAPCNVVEGAQSYPWVLAYRANPPAAQIGLEVRYGQHRPYKPRGGWEALAVAAAQRPTWMPTMPDDPEQAAMLAEFWPMFREIGQMVLDVRAERQMVESS